MPRPIYCPACEHEIRRDKLNFLRPFPCPSCQRLLYIPPYYKPIPGIGAALLSLTLGYSFGIRDVSLILFVIVLWFPLAAFLFGALKLKYRGRILEYFSENLTLR
jgi:hypothetical protein